MHSLSATTHLRSVHIPLTRASSTILAQMRADSSFKCLLDACSLPHVANCAIKAADENDVSVKNRSFGSTPKTVEAASEADGRTWCVGPLMGCMVFCHGRALLPTHFER